ncbi:MAG: hypothetical protein DMD99_23245 [Candidatus Rokuibacteriota bacterium]|nr:MAG: hypothetical protein DMD99_23245 [Candidatus Rokubacteria bacterium]
MRPLADLRPAANPRRRRRKREAIRPVARSRRSGILRQRGAGVTTTEDSPNVEREGAPTASQWRLPKLRVDVNGDWFDDDVEITHAGILANLRSVLRRDAQGYYIQTRIRIPVEVEDVPFVVARIERRGEVLHAILSDGTDADVDPATLRVSHDDVPYCAVRDGAFEARLSRAAAFQLLALADYDEGTGRGTLRVGGREYPLRRRA